MSFSSKITTGLLFLSMKASLVFVNTPNSTNSFNLYEALLILLLCCCLLML